MVPCRDGNPGGCIRYHAIIDLSRRDLEALWIAPPRSAHHLSKGMVDRRKCDALCFGLGAFHRPLSFGERRAAASCQIATCRRSSRPKSRSAISAGPPGPDPQLQRSIQVWRCLIRGDLKRRLAFHVCLGLGSLAPVQDPSNRMDIACFSSSPGFVPVIRLA